MSVFEKYNLKIINNKRYYKFDFSKKIYGYELENSIPYLFKYQDLIIQTGTWSQLAVQITLYLYEKNPKSDEELLSISYDFGKSPVFSREKKPIFHPFKNLFLNTNHSSGHSFRSIQTILEFFGVDLKKCYFLIRRHISSEPSEVKEYFRNNTIIQYKKYLRYKGYNNTKIQTIINNFNIINQYLTNMGTSYNDFFLFDDFNYFIDYKSKFIKYINKKYKLNEGFIKKCNLNLDYLENFYRIKIFFEKMDFNDMDSLKNKIVKETNLLFESLESCVISSHKLLSIMKLKYKDDMNKINELKDPNYFFQICKLFLDKNYIYKKPFISKSKNIHLSNNELIVQYAYSLEKITLSSLIKYADKMHLKRIDNILKFFIDLSDQYVQIDIDTLLDKNVLNISEELISKIKYEISFYINSFGIIDTTRYLGYSSLPFIDLKWNKYLLVGIIRTFLGDTFKVEYTNNAYNKADFMIEYK